MSAINQVHTTKSGGRLHVAADQHYLGSLKVYENRFIAFFARLFQMGIHVDCNGKQRTINRKEYVRFLSNLQVQNVSVKTVKQFNVLKEVLANAAVSQIQATMREAIDDTKRRRLFGKLAHAISSGDVNQACKMIGKGAALEMPFFHREGLRPAFHSDAEGLGSSKYQFQVIKGTPLLIAAMKGQASVVQMLARFGANANTQGETYAFQREITSVTQHPETVMRTQVVNQPQVVYTSTPVVHVHPGHVHGRPHVHAHGRVVRPHVINQPVVVSRPETVIRTVVNTQDTRTNARRVAMNPQLQTYYAN